MTDKIEQVKKTINEALGMCSERSPRWRSVVLKLEEVLQQCDTALYSPEPEKVVCPELCSCGNPQSFPIPHEHDQTDREKQIIKHYELLLSNCRLEINRLEKPVPVPPELLTEIANYLTQQFICSPKELPADECVTEAKYIITKCHQSEAAIRIDETF